MFCLAMSLARAVSTILMVAVVWIALEYVHGVFGFFWASVFGIVIFSISLLILSREK